MSSKRQLARRRRRRQNARQRALAAQGAPKDPLLRTSPTEIVCCKKLFSFSWTFQGKKAHFKWVIQTIVTDTHKEIRSLISGGSVNNQLNDFYKYFVKLVLGGFFFLLFLGKFWSISQSELTGANEQKMTFVGETLTKLSKLVIFGMKFSNSNDKFVTNWVFFSNKKRLLWYLCSMKAQHVTDFYPFRNRFSRWASSRIVEQHHTLGQSSFGSRTHWLSYRQTRLL